MISLSDCSDFYLSCIHGRRKTSFPLIRSSRSKQLWLAESHLCQQTTEKSGCAERVRCFNWKGSVLKGLEKHSDEQCRKLEAQRAAASIYDDDDKLPLRSRNNFRRDEDDDENIDTDINVKENYAVEANKKEKPKKLKKPKVTVAEDATEIHDISAKF